MSSCFNCCGQDEGDEREREPLMPRQNYDTERQGRFDEKLHTYQMGRAISRGFMPSNLQLTAHLRAFITHDRLNMDKHNISPSGRALVKTYREFVELIIQTLEHKNSDDQVQELIWNLKESRIGVDTRHIRSRASDAWSDARPSAALASLQTIGSLLLTNSDFRLFLSEVGSISRGVFQDTARGLADVSQQAADQVEHLPRQTDPGVNGKEKATPATAPSTETLKKEVAEFTDTVAEGATDVAHVAVESAKARVDKHEQETLVNRLKKVVTNLRQRDDYSQSVSTVTHIIQNYISAYLRAASNTIEVAEEDVTVNPHANEVGQRFWQLLTSFGDTKKWDKVNKSFNAFIEESQDDSKSQVADKLVQLFQEMLTNPEFYEDAKGGFQGMRERAKEISKDSPTAEKLDEFVENLISAILSLEDDEDMQQLHRTSKRMIDILLNSDHKTRRHLLNDLTNIFIPLAIDTVQYIPIPRLEITTPAIDLLIENLILEPGKTVNRSSFFPYNLHISTQNDLDVQKARLTTVTTATSIFKFSVSGISIAAEELGFWMHLHTGIWRFIDEGIANFYLDERGIDLEFEVEIGRERLEQMIAVRNVKVNVHHLDYTLKKSTFACLAWVFKPIIRPIIKATIESQIEEGIRSGLHFVNRELVFARERLRAARIASPNDMWSFIKAVASRLAATYDPEIDARVGVRPGGIFEGKYAPGSLVRMWDMEEREAEYNMHREDVNTWRNRVFDLKPVEVGLE